MKNPSIHSTNVYRVLKWAGYCPRYCYHGINKIKLPAFMCCSMGETKQTNGQINYIMSGGSKC